MIFVAIAILSVRVFAEPIFSGEKVKPYEVTETWVQNFIKFERVVETKSGKKKIVPIGCVPTNSEEGPMLAINATRSNTDFAYACKQDEDGIVNYEATGCFSRDGRALRIGQARILDNGTTIEKCDYGINGAVAKSVETASGCFGKRAVYFDGAEWVQEVEIGSDGLLEGKWMKCFRPHNGYYESHVIGCASDTLLVASGDTAELRGGHFVKCVEKGNNEVAFELVDKKELNCEHDNATVEHGSVWNDTSRGALLRCQNTQVIKIGCLIGDQILDLGQEVSISLGAPEHCVFLCHKQSNAYVCPRKIGDYHIVEENGDSATTPSSASTSVRPRPSKSTNAPLSRLLALRKYKKNNKKSGY